MDNERTKNGQNKSIVNRIIVMVIVFILAICLLVAGGILYKKTSSVRNKVKAEVAELKMSIRKTDISGYEPMIDEEGAWYTKYHFIAHAGGAVDGKLYTNSLEAMEHSYVQGNRVFDIDIELTEDGKLVLRHSWNDNLETSETAIHDSKRYVDMNGCQQYTYMGETMNYEEFMSTPIFYRYKPMDCINMLKFMDSHKDLYVTIDMKADVITGYRLLVELAKSLEIEEVLKRIIVNIYDYEIVNRKIPLSTKIIDYITSNLEDESYKMTKMLLFNDKSVDEVAYDNLKGINAIHLFVVSGFHISFFYSLITKMFKKKSVVGKIIGLTVCFFYVFLLDFSLSATRALITLFINKLFSKYFNIPK